MYVWGCMCTQHTNIQAYIEFWSSVECGVTSLLLIPGAL